MDDTTTISSSHFSIDKFSKMNSLISSIKVYMDTKTENACVLINQLLQALSVSQDLSIFDPHTNIANKFFLSLYDLMNILEPRSLTSWYCVDLLINVCKNQDARKGLVNTYQYLPCLGKMINNNLTNEKKCTLLKLLQNITYGIKLRWQIPHFTHLISVLCKWIEDRDMDIVTLSLGIIVNLCYKNLITLSLLQRHVDLKNFIKGCLTLKGAITEVYVCHALIILENVSGYVPSDIWPKLIDNTFVAIIQAYERKDIILLKLVTDFFVDRMKDDYQILTGYTLYKERVCEILDMINEKNQSDEDIESICVILNFLNFLIELKVPLINPLYPPIANLALKWIQETSVSYQAVTTLKSITTDLNKSEQKDILQSFVTEMPTFLSLLNSYQNESANFTAEYVNRLAALLQLVTELLKYKETRRLIVEQLEEAVFIRFFSRLLGDDVPKFNETICSIHTVNMYVYALNFLEQLTTFNGNWLRFVTDLLLNKQICIILARAINCSPPNVKKMALILSSKTSTETVSGILSNLQSVLPATEQRDINGLNFNNNELNLNCFSVKQSERINDVLDKLENLVAKSEISSLEISDLMELYNSKLSNIAQTEMTALASLECATRHCTHLQHSVIKLTAEQFQLEQSKLFITKNLEQSLKKQEELRANLKDVHSRLEEEKGRSKKYNSELKLITKNVIDFQNQLNEQENKISQLIKEKNDLDEQLNSYKGLYEKVEGNCKILERTVKRKDELIECNNLKNENYRKEIEELKNTLMETEKKFEECQVMLKKKSAILDNISSLATSRS